MYRVSLDEESYDILPDTEQEPVTSPGFNWQEHPRSYGLADTENVDPSEINQLRQDWMDHAKNGLPLYIVTQTGKMWHISPHPNGMGISIHELIPRYEYAGEAYNFEGPDAWSSLESAKEIDSFAHYNVLPLDKRVNASNSPWLLALQRMAHAHQEILKRNPYRKR